MFQNRLNVRFWHGGNGLLEPKVCSEWGADGDDLWWLVKLARAFIARHEALSNESKAEYSLNFY